MPPIRHIVDPIFTNSQHTLALIDKENSYVRRHKKVLADYTRTEVRLTYRTHRSGKRYHSTVIHTGKTVNPTEKPQPRITDFFPYVSKEFAFRTRPYERTDSLQYIGR